MRTDFSLTLVSTRQKREKNYFRRQCMCGVFLVVVVVAAADAATVDVVDVVVVVGG